jgi:hypothetical protein
VQADLLETAVTEDIEAMLRDEQFMARIWAEANKRLGSEKPVLERVMAEGPAPPKEAPSPPAGEEGAGP